ncbi:MAG: hypothetical protein AAF761_04660 [Pseudomonadota bacterium]
MYLSQAAHGVIHETGHKTPAESPTYAPCLQTNLYDRHLGRPLVAGLFLAPLLFGALALAVILGLGWALGRFAGPLFALALYGGSLIWCVWLAIDVLSRCAENPCEGSQAVVDLFTAFAVTPMIAIICVVLGLRALGRVRSGG